MNNNKTDSTVPDYGKDNLHQQPLSFFMDKYTETDPAEIADRIGLETEDDGRVFLVRYLGHIYRVSHPELNITPAEEGMTDLLSDNDSARILLLRYLQLAHPTPPDGTYVSFRDMPGGDLYFQPFQGRCIFRLLGKYGRRIDVFRSVLASMGAQKIEYADACYDVELFDGLFVRFILWEGDDEFPASAQILFSFNFRNAFETYDLAEIGGLCISAFGAEERKLAEKTAENG